MSDERQFTKIQPCGCITYLTTNMRAGKIPCLDHRLDDMWESALEALYQRHGAPLASELRAEIDRIKDAR